MDNRVKRFLSLAMAIIMVIGLMPTNIVFATENEGEQDPSLVLGNPEQTPEPPQDQNDPNQGLMLAGAQTHELGCMLGATHDGACKIKCDNFAECKLEKGHTGDCVDAGNNVLVRADNVRTEAGLRAAIATGGTIVLNENITLHGALTVNSEVILNMNGKSITAVAAEEGQSAPAYALINNGTLTINGNGSVAGVLNNGTLTIQNGTFTAAASDAYAVCNKGTATVEGGTFNQAGSGYALWNDTSDELYIEGGTITGVYNNQGKLDIEGGKFYSVADKNAIWSKDGSLDISAGQFQKDEGNETVATVKVDGNPDSASISGGTFSHSKGLSLELAGTAVLTIGGTAEVDDGIKIGAGAELTINGGTFEDPAEGETESDYIVESGAQITVNGGTYVDTFAQDFAEPYAAPKKVILFGTAEMVKTADDAVTVSPVIAKIGSDAYPSLEAAVNDADTGDEIKLVAEANLGATVEIETDVAIILNLNGQNVKASFADDAIRVKVGGNLTINGDGNITNTLDDAIMNNGTLVVNGGTFEGYYALYNGSYFANTAQAILNGGTFKAAGTDNNIAVANFDKMLVAGATIEDALSTFGIFEMTDGQVDKLVAGGADAAVASGISTEISGGEVACLDVCNDKGTLYSNEVTVKGTADIEIVKVRKHESVAEYSAVMIEAGNVESVNAYQFDDADNETLVVNAPISITGGTFTYCPYNGYVSAGYEIITLRGENDAVYGYRVRLKKADLEKPAANNFDVKNVGTGITVNSNTILDNIAVNDSFKEAENDSGYLLVIKPVSIVVDNGDAEGTYKASRITYDVSLKNKPSTDERAYRITFNLPIPGTLPEKVEYANVYHGNELLGLYEIKEVTIDGNKYYYVTVTYDKFSPFTVELIDVNTAKHSAKIGVKGYKTVQDAVNAAEDGDVIELLDFGTATGVGYGKVVINETKNNNAKRITIDGKGNTWLYAGTEAAIEIVRGAGDAGLVTIRNVKFQKTNGNAIIDITGSGNKATNVQITNCDFADPDAQKDIVAINLSNTNGVVIDGGTASGLQAFLVNAGGQNLTVKNVTVSNSAVGMTLGQTTGVKVINVDITAANNQYGISLEGTVDRFAAEFNNCTIDAYVPIMVWNTDANGNVAFKGNNKFTARNEGKYWCVLGDQAFVGESAPKNAADLSTGKDDRIVITVTDTELNGDGINYKHKDETNASERKYYTVAPEGKLDVGAVVFDDATTKNDSRISVEIADLVASERVVLRVANAQGTTIAEAKLTDSNNAGYLYFNALTGVVGVSRPNGTWETTWIQDNITGEKVPTYKTVPAKIYLVVDGKVLNANNPAPVKVNDESTPDRLWTDVEGVGNVTVSVNRAAPVWKHTLAEAFNAVPASETVTNKGTVTLFADNDAILSALGEVTGNKEITVTGTATFNWDLGEEWLYVGRGENPGNGTLIFDDAHIRAHGDGDDTGLNISGKKETDAKVCNGIVKVINGSDVEVDFINNRNLLEVSGGAKGPSTLTVKHGFHVNGRKGAPDAKVEVKDGSHLIISQDLLTTATLGDDVAQEGNGILNVIGSRFTCVGKFNVASGSAFNVSGTSTLNIGEAVGKPINLLDDAVIVNSSVGGAAVANGAENAKINVQFENTVKFDRVETKYTDVTATGVNNFGNLSVLFGELHTNTESKINVGTLTVDEGNWPIIIDTTNLQPAKAVRVINQLNAPAADLTSRAKTTESTSYVVYGEGEDAGDVAASKIDRTEVYFNPDYERTEAQQFGDKVADGRYQGINAFDKFKVVSSLMVLPKETTTIVLATDNAEAESYGQLLSAQDLVVKTEGDVSKFAVIDRILNAREDLTIDRDAKVKVLGLNGSSGADNLGGLFTVNGELVLENQENADSAFKLWKSNSNHGRLAIGPYGKLTLEKGKLTNDGEIAITGNGMVEVKKSSIVNEGSIAVEFTGDIKAQNITGSGTITIDTTGMVDREKVLVIDLSGNAATKALMESDKVQVKNNAAAKYVNAEGDVYVYYEAFVDADGNQELSLGEGYATLEAAVAAAEAGKTVVLLENADVSVVEITKGIKLDLNGKTVSGVKPLKVTAKNVEITNGNVKATDTGIEVADKADLTLTKVKVEATKTGVLTAGAVTMDKDTEIAGVGGLTFAAGVGVGIEMRGESHVTVPDGEISGRIAVLIHGGRLDVTGGTIDGDKNYAIGTVCDGGAENVDNAVVNISNGNIIGKIQVSRNTDGNLPADYTAKVTITGGTFTKSGLSVAGETNTIVVSNADNPAIFDKWVALELCATDYICQEKKDSNPVVYEVVPYEHVRIFMEEADIDGDKVLVGGEAYVNGVAYKVQPGKVLLIDKEMAKTHRMFITTYTYETKGTADTKDDYPNAMYVWYAEGKNKQGDIYTAYTVERFERLDNFFEYNGTSIRIGGTGNGIRFISSVNETDVRLLMNGTMIEEGALGGAKLTEMGTEFWKTNRARSQVFGGTLGNQFNIYKTVNGRNRFTGMLVNLGASEAVVAEPFFSRPYAVIQLKDTEETMTLFGGTLERSIYYVAQQVDAAGSFHGTPYDSYVKNLLNLGANYRPESGTGNS